MDRGTLIQRRRGGGAVAAFVVLCLIAAMLIPAVSNRAEPYDVTDDQVMCVTGLTDAAMAGKSVAFLDINHDGIGDLVVGAPGDSTAGASSGKVMIYLGDVIEPDPDVSITGSAGERFGFAVARAGDVNADGIDDLIVGAPSNDTGSLDAGAMYIIFGSEDLGDLPGSASDADVIIAGEEGEDAGGALGYSVSTAGDVNLDGYDDVLVGVPFAGAGKVYLLYGGSSMDGTPDKTFTGSTVGERFGFALAGGMNLDGSAQPDVVVGAPFSSLKKGAVQVILNPAKGTPKVVTLTGATAGDELGTSVAVLDYNGDIYGDVAVGAPKADSVGKVYLYYGSALSGKFDMSEDVAFSVGQAGDMFGLSIASGDPRTDGVGDLIVGAPMNDTADIDAGRAYVFYGDEAADSEPDVVVEGIEAASRFGWSVATGDDESADYNANGSADFAVGAPNNGTDTEGAAYLYEGILVVGPADPTVYGYVLDAKTSEGLNNALVTIEGPVSDSVRTTANGSYASEEPLPPGTYWINASYDDYFTGESGPLELVSGTDTNVSFDMDKLPVVQGFIYDGNGTDPLVDVLEDALVEVRDSSENLLDSLTTDATGDYYFMLEVKDDITITATKEYYFAGSIELTVEGHSNITENITLDHYPILMFTANDTDGDPIESVEVSVEIGGELLVTGETDASGDATLMVPGVGSAYVNSSRSGYVPGFNTTDLFANETAYVNVTMDREPSLSGTIKDALFETPVSGATIDLFVSGSTDILESETSDSHGFYTFDVVEEGTYDLNVTATGYLKQGRSAVDVAPDEAATEDFWLEADTIPPTSEISDPQPGLLYLTPEVTVFANATDPNENGIFAVALYFSHEGKPYELWDSADREAPYMFEFDASQEYGNGIYEFYTIAWDLASNMEPTPTANDTWIIMDADLPVSEVDALDPYQGTDTFTVTASGSDPFGVKFVELWYSYDGGAFDLYGLNDTDTTYSWEFAAADGDGEYAFYSILVNGVDQREPAPDEPDTSTLLDTTDPTATISSPEDDPPLDTGTVELEAEVADVGAGLDYVSYQVDSEDEIVVDLEDGQASYDLAVTLNLEDGEHTVTVRATDDASNEGEDSVTFTVDTTPPTVSITAPEEDAIIDSSSVVITWTATDAVTTERSVDGGTWEAVTGTSVTISPLADDEHTVEIRVTDEAGNQASAIVNFTVDTYTPVVDTTAPTVSITSPADSSSLDTSSVAVTWTASDGTGSGIDTIEVNLDAGAWTTVTGSSHEFTALAEGTHVVSVRVTDNAGNAATATATFMVDTVDPSLSITSPEAAWETEDKSVTVTWTCTDAGCGIDRIEVCIDDDAFTSVGTASERIFSDLEAGEHTVDVRAYDKAGNMVETSVTFTVTEGGGISALLIAGIVLAIIVVAAVAVMLMRRKNAPEPPVE